MNGPGNRDGHESDYYEDIQLCMTNSVLAGTILLPVSLVALPFVVGDYTLYLQNLIAIDSIEQSGSICR